MYRLKLYEDPYFDLVELPIHGHLKYDDYRRDGAIINPPKGMVIAGGAALWMATTSDDVTSSDGRRSREYSDIDMFFVCTKEEAEKILESEIEKMPEEDECGIGKNSITLDMDR
jgi:hypothetical protein